jgi:hypothetical protein
MHTIYGPLNARQTTIALETLHYRLHLVSNRPKKNFPKDNVDPNYEFFKDNRYSQLTNNKQFIANQ